MSDRRLGSGCVFRFAGAPEVPGIQKLSMRTELAFTPINKLRLEDNTRSHYRPGRYFPHSGGKPALHSRGDMTEKSIHFLNGKLVPEKDLVISPRDLGYSRGFAVFDFMETYERRPFMLESHINRLFMSAEAISLEIPWSKEEVSSWVLRTLEANSPSDAEMVIRITISGGVSFNLATSGIPTVVITVEPKLPCPPCDYDNGVEIALVEFERYRPEAKTNNYIEAIRILKHIGPHVDEVIYYSDNFVREGSRCNIFALLGERLLTPKTKVLGGVTREVLLDNVKLSIPIVAEDFLVEDLYEASEIFITATGKGIMPVTKVAGSPVGSGEVGSVTKKVANQYRAFMRSGNW